MSAARLILSSGDPLVDRRMDWARALMAEGNPGDAAALLDEAVARADHYAPGWFLLGEAREALGEAEAARAAYERALDLDPADTLGAGLHVVRLGGTLPDAGGAGTSFGMSEAYVRTLFDQYADRFDAALARLGYRGPELIHAALTEACATLAQAYAFGRGLDLGCGTGLVAARLADHVGALEGVDLSPNMIALATRRGVYERVVAGEMVAFLKERPAEDADLIFAGDAFCYLDDLRPILNESARVLEPGGLLAFTVETHDGAGILLRDTLRFAHAEPYVRAALAEAGLALVSCAAQSTRTEKEQPVPGLVVVAQRVS
ncbi:class I SAM-dependent DNA methyltransferase [Ancylobacter sp. SL191]|uniref:class I SAM-dependent DNA methyltransferase n=1 Tax=Ancylobacter sp. SL191 TaxID=2995166 RepID=UPI00226FEBE8|nr:methyltransferase domain-containing protein [Ancylobacter sp. SL191]WAC27654.1 methyltransferase domain-containing protein [Ancylobacter sp. SL191]